MEISTKKIILYECGAEAEYFLYNNLDIINNIIFCIDRNKTGFFHGKPIYRIEDVNGESFEKKLIIIASGDYKCFINMSENLNKLGLKEFDDYIWSKCYKKKIVCINANCHGDALEKYLTQSDKFNSCYFIYPNPRIFMNSDKEIKSGLLENTDVYIHQDIRSDNSYGYKFSDEYTLSKLKKDVCIICMPNVVGFGKRNN